MTKSNVARRISRLERSLCRLPPPSGRPTLIKILGGITGQEPYHASIHGRRLQRGLNETVAEFEERALAVAAELGEEFAIVGGLPPWNDGMGMS